MHGNEIEEAFLESPCDDIGRFRRLIGEVFVKYDPTGSVASDITGEEEWRHQEPIVDVTPKDDSPVWTSDEGSVPRRFGDWDSTNSYKTEDLFDNEALWASCVDPPPMAARVLKPIELAAKYPAGVGEKQASPIAGATVQDPAPDAPDVDVVQETNAKKSPTKSPDQKRPRRSTRARVARVSFSGNKKG